MATKKDKELVRQITSLLNELPIEKKWYLLGYAQSEADKNINARKDT